MLPFVLVRLFFCELFQHLVRVFDLFVDGVTHPSQDIHHVAHQLVGISFRDETLHSLVSGHVRYHADAQRNVTCYQVDLVAIRRTLCGVKPTLKVKRRAVRVVAQRLGDSDVLIVQTFQHGRSRVVHAARIDSAHTSLTGTFVPYAIATRISINSHRIFDINTSDNTYGHLGCRKSVSREG